MVAPSAMAGEPRFPHLAVDVDSSEADELGYTLLELGSSGVELRDETTLPRGPGPEQVRLLASFPSRQEAARARAQLLESFPEKCFELGETVGDAWRDAYKEYFKPFALTSSLCVAPPWIDYQAKEGETVMWLDPGRAFGTGLHATTALAAAELDRRRALLASEAVLDVGTGSGILAIAALLLGAREVIAIDVDPEVIEVARGNARRNDLSDRVEVSTTPLSAVRRSFSVVVANIRAETLSDLAPELTRVVRAGGLLVLSGVLDQYHDEVLGHFAVDGAFEHLGSARRGDGDDAWVAISLRRAGA